MTCDEMLKRLDDLKTSGRADGQSLDDATNAVMAYRGAYRVRLALVGRRLPAVVDAIMDGLERKALAALDQAHCEEMLAKMTVSLDRLKASFATILAGNQLRQEVVEAILEAHGWLVEAEDRVRQLAIRSRS